MLEYGERANFEARLDHFRDIFSVEGVPTLQCLVPVNQPQVRLILWAWNQDEIPDVYVAEALDGSLVLLCGAVTDFGCYGGSPEPYKNNAQRVLDLWLEFGDSAIDEINGSFSCAFVNKMHQEVVAYADRFASRSVWFGKDGGRIILGNIPSAIAAIKEKSPQLDPAGLWSFFHAGRVVGDRGLYADTRCLMAGEKFILQPNSTPKRLSWAKIHYDADPGPSPADWGCEIASALRRSAARYRRTMQSPKVFLSGGLDSRIAAAALGKPLEAITLCTQRNAEARVARVVSALLRIDHTVVLRSPYWYIDAVKASALSAAGSFQTCHNHFPVVLKLIRERDPFATFLLGDMLENFNKHYFRSDEVMCTTFDTESVCTVLFNHASYVIKGNKSIGRYFVPEIREALRKRYIDALTENVSYIKTFSADPVDCFDSFFRWANVAATPTYIMISGIWPIARECNLRLDNELFQLNLRIPSQTKGAGIIHPWVLFHLNKILPAIPDANTFVPPLMPKEIGGLAKKIRPMLGRTLRALNAKKSDVPDLRTSGSWLIRHEMYRKDARYRDFIQELISSSEVFPPEMFDNSAMRKAWNQ